MAVLRRQVLRKYKEILRVSSSWKASEEAETASERQYIRDEARKLFRKNKKLSDEAEIQLCLEEATARLEMALHYGNPYPRPVNLAPGSVIGSRDKKGQSQKFRESQPVYTHSLDK